MATNTNTQNGSKKEFLKKLGVIWKKQSANGKQYYSGTLNLKEIGFDKDVPIVIFQNTTQREGKKDPDLSIFLSTPREGAAPAKSTPKEKPTPAPVPSAAQTPSEEVNDVL